MTTLTKEKEMEEEELPVLEEEEPEADEEEDELTYEPDRQYNASELHMLADKMLKEDSNRELCRKCWEEDPDSLPYGEETGQVESEPQYDALTAEPLLDGEGNQLYLDYPEFKCDKGHRWFKGEGKRRDIRGPNPILFDSHLKNRKRREIMVQEGIPDPAFTMDRFGRPSQGLYNRSHPAGRKINTKEQRQRNGASWYR